MPPGVEGADAVASPTTVPETTEPIDEVVATTAEAPSVEAPTEGSPENQAETQDPATPETPAQDQSTLTEDQITQLLNELDPDGTKLNDITKVSLELMAQFGITLSEERARKLAQMDVEEFRDQPEYGQVLFKDDELLLATLSKSNSAELKQIEEEIIEELPLDPRAPENQDKTLQDLIDKTEPQPQKNRLKELLLRMAFSTAEITIESFADINLGEFFEAFFRDVDSGAAGWERFYERNKDGKAELFSNASVTEFLHKDKNMVNVLYETYEQLTRHEPPLIDSKPSFLQKDAQLTQEQLLELWTQLQEAREKHEEEVTSIFEHVMGEVMKRPNPGEVVIDNRFFKQLEDMTHNPQDKKGQELIKKFITPAAQEPQVSTESDAELPAAA